MTPQQLQLARRVYHEHVAGRARSAPVTLPAGDLLDVLNTLWQEERRADMHGTRLKTLWQRAIDAKVEALLIDEPERGPADGGPGAAPTSAVEHTLAGPAAD